MKLAKVLKLTKRLKSTKKSRLTVLLLALLVLPLFVLPLSAWEENDSVPHYSKMEIGKNRFVVTPILQHLTQTEAAFVWITAKESFSWLEYKKSDDNWIKVTREKEGLLDGGTTLHRAFLADLSPSTLYQFRIQAKTITSFAWLPIYGTEFASENYNFTTRGANPDEFSFGVLNDLHHNTKAYATHIERARELNLQGVMLNGDSVDDFRRTKDVVNFMLKPAQGLEGAIPLYNVRGNHETRGAHARELSHFFYTPNGNIYQLLLEGETAILLTDTGEDKPDDHKEYAGMVDFDSYREKEEQWFREVFASPEWKNAKYKIAVGHIPVYQYKHKKDYMTSKEWQIRWQELYNEAGVQLLIAAHTHRTAIIEPHTMGNDYTIFIGGGPRNSASLMITCTTKNNKIEAKALHLDGQENNSLTIEVPVPSPELSTLVQE